ncbi:nucleolar protein 14 isoform X2 [Pteropus alecto]|uniref:nucleolar protein 14 isoform X2 n=1 Tax=Pteropus alecto TaxID=9402 RepID=UPI000D539FC1|nr:nucleolar protein 14 isoform X2 [Pteropus alecto]
MGKARAAGARTKTPAGARGGGTRPNSNPFEVKVNRQKFQVLGRKTRHDVGLPGVSRARAIQKRCRTLLKEYKERDKSNVFVDKRLGEYNSNVSLEEKMLKRFALEQQRQHEKKNIYNLNEDEELTHYGQSLADIEKHNDIVDSDSDAEDRGALSAELTAAHFGGGEPLHKKPAPQPGEDGERPRSRKELIEELIAESKREKRERQARREDALELTEKLDQDWREIRALLARRAPKPGNREQEKPTPDAYDVMVRELGFEMKAQPSNRMKTEEELAKEEQERLKNLEADRLRRMRGKDEDEDTKPKHTSADDLSDGFILDQDDRRLLSYKDGKMNVEEEQSGEASDRESAEDAGEDTREDDAEDSSGSEGHSDLESDGESEGESERPGQAQQRASGHVSPGGSGEAASTELPYVFAAPEACEDLKSLLSGRPTEEQLLVLERIQKCHHPSLAAGNRAKLEKLFGFLLEYIGDLATDEPPALGTIDKLVVQLYNLCQMFPESASSCMKFVLRDAMHEMEGMVEAKGRAVFPGLDVLIYLKIAGMLFPTSDFRHPVVTPALVCLSQLLTKCPVLSLQDAVKGLFVCCVFLDYVSLSRRFVPELINFLLGILYIAAPNSQSPEPLARTRNCSWCLMKRTRPRGRGGASPCTGQVGHQPGLRPRPTTSAGCRPCRLSCLAVCLALVKRCVLMYSGLPSFHDIVRPLRALLTEHLASCSHPRELQELIRGTLTDMEAQEQHCQPLICAKSKPVPLKLFTPRLVKVLEFGRKQGSSREEQERKRLMHKHRREFKGAVREIRKDNQFLARMQLAETMERDAERKRKVKQLFNSLAAQEGAWRALKRKKLKR